MNTDPDLSVILTAHREGIIAGVTARSALAALKQIHLRGLKFEIIVVLDRADDITKDVLQSVLGPEANYVETDEGDPGAARNIGIAAARGSYAAFLDGDDLWSDNWLVEAFDYVSARPNTVGHSACNYVFGEKNLLWWHNDSEAEICDKNYLLWGNYWDAMSFAPIKIYRDHKFRKNDLTAGFGHEDWHWNAITIAAGISHRPVPNTMHFKRARKGSQMEKVNALEGIAWPVLGSPMKEDENMEPTRQS